MRWDPGIHLLVCLSGWRDDVMIRGEERGGRRWKTYRENESEGDTEGKKKKLERWKGTRGQK